VTREHGPVALVHFDAHLDTWDTYFDAPITHGTIFRRAFEEKLLVEDHSVHIGIRGPLYDRADLDDDAGFGFRTIRASDVDVMGVRETIGVITERTAGLPVYLSLDIDVLDPAFAPGTGTAEPGGLMTRELLWAVRTVSSQVDLCAMDMVEVSPPYDPTGITAMAGHRVVLETLSGIALRRSGREARPERP